MNEMANYRPIEAITEEILFYKAQAGAAILEIGKRLNEAKAQLPHGEWLGWLQEKVDFSESTAQRFMRLAKEYENPSPVTDLGASKALVLLALPPLQRDEFLEENDAESMSKRELEKAVKEKLEAMGKKLLAAEEAERTAAEAQKQAEAKAEELRKRLAATGNTDVALFKADFTRVQETFEVMLERLAKVESEDAATGKKLRNAFQALLDSFGAQLEGGEQ